MRPPFCAAARCFAAPQLTALDHAARRSAAAPGRAARDGELDQPVVLFLSISRRIDDSVIDGESLGLLRSRPAGRNCSVG